MAFIIETGLSVFTPDISHIEKAFDIIQKSSVKVILLCGTQHNTIYLVKHIFKDVTFILPPNWTPNLDALRVFPEIFNCSLSFNFWFEANAEFKKFVDSFHPVIYPKDKLLEHMWMTVFFCLSGNKSKDNLYERFYGISLHNCSGQESLLQYSNTGEFSSNRTSDPVYHAVAIMVNGVHNLYSSPSGFYLDGQTQDKEIIRHKVTRNVKIRFY